MNRASSARTDVVVIGAGMAGLAAARILRGAGLQVTVVEREHAVGGRVATSSFDGVPIDVGAQFLTDFSDRALALVAELGLSGHTRSLSLTAGAVLRSGRLRGVRAGRGLPLTDLLSRRARARVLRLLWTAFTQRAQLDVHAPERAHRLDTRSVADLLAGTVDEELAAYLVEPLLSSFLYWTRERTTQAMLLLLLRAGLSARRLLVLEPGLGILAEALATGLDVRLGTEAKSIVTGDGGATVVAAGPGGRITLPCDAVVCAAPATAVPALVPDLDASRRAFFARAAYAPCLVVAVSVDRRLPRRYYGLLFPPRESRHLAMAAVQSARGSESLPPGRDVVLLYASGPASRALLTAEAGAVRHALLSDLRLAGPAYDPGADERGYRLYRWPQAIPEFPTGRLRQLHQFSRQGWAWGPTVFAGDYLSSPMVDGALASGQRAARIVIRRLSCQARPPARSA